MEIMHSVNNEVEYENFEIILLHYSLLSTWSQYISTFEIELRENRTKHLKFDIRIKAVK